MNANIYMVNDVPATIPANGYIPLGNIVRRYCRAIDGTGAGIILKEPGYYKIDYSVIFNGAATGTAVIEAYANGEAVPGSVADETIGTASTEVHTVTKPFIVRVLRSTAPVTVTLQNAGSIALNVAEVTITAVKV